MLDPIIGGALITGGASLLGNILGGSAGAGASKYAADKQAEVTRETNAQNKELFYEQNRINRENWEAENLYNSPAQQRKRLEEAGLNPYLAMNGSNSAGSISSASAPTMQTPDIASPLMERARYIQQMYANGLPSAIGVVGSALQAAERHEQVQSLKLQNTFNAETIVSRMLQTAEQTKNWQLKNQAQSIQNNILDSTQNYIIESKRLDNAFKKAQVENEWLRVTSNEINNSIQRYNLDYLPKMYQTQLAKEIAQVALFETQNDASKQSIKESISRTAKTWAETTGVRLSNKWIDKISESTAGKIKAEQKRILGQYHLDKRDLDNMFGYYLNNNVVPAIRGLSDAGRTLAPLLIK